MLTPFLVAMTSSPSKYAARCSNSVKSSTEDRARCEPKLRWMFTPRRLGVSIRCRNSCGRMSPTSWVAPLVCPLAWQSKQVTPREATSLLRSSVWLNCCCGKGVTSRRSPSRSFGLRIPLNSS